MSNEIHVETYLLDGVGNNTRGEGMGWGRASEPPSSTQPKRGYIYEHYSSSLFGLILIPLSISLHFLP